MYSYFYKMSSLNVNLKDLRAISEKNSESAISMEYGQQISICDITL